MTALINLYDKNETSFVTNGLVVLSDCKSCFNTEELNGQYETELEYPIDPRGKWQYLQEGNVIKADGQLFRIYHKIKTLTGLKINARHIFYDLLDNLIEEIDIRALTGAAALDRVMTNTAYVHNFVYMTDITAVNSIALDDETGDIIDKNPIEAIFFLISLYGGELVRDNFNIKLLQSRGQDRGVLISYGKNIKGIEEDINLDSVITKIKPIGADGLTLPEKYVDSPYINNYPFPKIKPVEFSDCNTYEDLREAAQKYFQDNKCDIPPTNYKIDFAELSKTEEYKNYKVLETVYIGDIVTVKHTKLNINLKCKVIRIKKNVLTGRIEEVELGNFKQNIADAMNSIQTVTDVFGNAIEGDKLSKTFLQKWVDNATNLILKGNDGHVIQDENGISIMDTTDKMTCQKVWRWNLNGLGYSSTGWNGPFTTAITADGKIVADFMTAGEFNGAIIKAGTVKMASLELNAQQTISSKASQSDLNSTNSTLGSVQADVNNLKTDNTTNKSAITTLQTQMSAVPGQIDSKVSASTIIVNSYTDTKTAQAISTASTDATNKANNAQTNANSYTDTKVQEAKDLANTAQSTANNAVTSAQQANSLLSDLSSDSKLTPVEKQQAKVQWDAIVLEKSTIDAQADKYTIDRSTYDSNYNTLNSYITPLLADLTTTSDIVGSDFRTKFSNYYSAKSSLLQSIANKAKDIADSAQSQASSANTNANNAVNTANNANSTAGTALSTANSANSTANSANSNANTALTNSSNAVNTANTANNTANNAANTANQANDNANDLKNNIIPQLTERVQTAEQKITPDAIVATVTDSTTYYSDTLIPSATPLVVSRAGPTINPLNSYNFTGGAAIPNNTLVTIPGGQGEYTPFPEGLEVYGTDTVTFDKQVDRVQDAESKIEQQAGKISLVVTESGGISTVNTASIVASINNGNSKINMSALNIDLSGYVTFSSLSTPGQTTIDGGNLKTSSVGADKIKVNELYVGSGGIRLDASASIGWGQVSSKPFIPQTAADVGARPNTWTPTASEVGARPNTWVPTAAQVGAISNTYIDGSGVFTANVYAANIIGNTLYINDYLQFMKDGVTIFKVGRNLDGSSPTGAGQLFLNDTCSLDTNGGDLRLRAKINNYIRINSAGGLDYYYPTGASTYNVIPIVDSNGVLQTGTGSNINVVVTPKFG